MNLIRSGWHVLVKHRRSWFWMNMIYFGLVAAAMIIAQFDRSIQEALVKSIGQSISEGPLTAVFNAYSGGDVLPAILLTLGFNLLLGSLVQISLPSLIIPFSGLIIGFLRAILWGFIFSPRPEFINLASLSDGLLIVGLLFLEGEGYVLGMLGVWIHGRNFLQPETAEVSGRGEGYRLGLKKHLLLYPWITLVLIIAAVYEVLIAIFILPG